MRFPGCVSPHGWSYDNADGGAGFRETHVAVEAYGEDRRAEVHVVSGGRPVNYDASILGSGRTVRLVSGLAAISVATFSFVSGYY